MSDIDTTAATQATSVPPSPSSPASLKSSQDASPSHTRSPSPLGRNLKRRRLESAFPENRYDANEFNHDNGSNHSSSAQSIPLSGTTSMDAEPTFMGHSREFMSYILSARGVIQWERATARSRHHLPSSHFGVGGLPKISADNSFFSGWREKAGTWPMEKSHPLHRSYTFPE